VTDLTCFTLAEREGVAELTLSRPEALNTMTPEFWGELPRVLRSLDAAGRTRVLVLASTGRHFSAGMDLRVFASGSLGTDTARAREGLRQKALLLQEAFQLLEGVRFPVLAAVQGGCIGGALDMACAADVRYATRDAFFVVQEINLGMMADLGTLQRLPRLLPPGLVRELAYTGDRLPATEAHRLGFVTRLFDSPAEMLESVRGVAARIAARSPLAVAGSKEAISFARDWPLPVALRMAATWQAGMLDVGEVAAHAMAGKSAPPPGLEPLEPLPGRI
jgi:enoyl-CoA hydratase